MKVALFSVRTYEREVFERVASANRIQHEMLYLNERLTIHTAAAAGGCRVVCCFASDKLDVEVLALLQQMGVELVCLRSAGYNHVDLAAASRLGLPIVRVPDYSPFAVAEHATALLLSLDRKLHRAFNRVRELNFSLEGLVGFDLHGKTVGVIGAGRIGKAFAQIMFGFGCRILIFDPKPDPSLQSVAQYVSMPELLKQSDVVSLHVPLTPETHHLLHQEHLALMKPTAILINTSRGALVDTKALIRALKSKRIGGAALDVYEEEEGLFYRDLSGSGIDDDMLARLLTFPNVVITAHQAFLTQEALQGIATTTLTNIENLDKRRDLIHRLN